MRQLLLSVVTAACLTPGILNAAVVERPINSIAAVVNGHMILQSAVNEQMNVMKEKAKAASIAPIGDKDLEHLVTDQLVLQELQLQIAQSHHITTTSKQVTQAVDTIAKENHISVSQLKEKIHKDGHDFSGFKQHVADQLTIMALQHQVVGGANVQVTPADIENYRQKNKLSHVNYLYQVGDILIITPDQMTAAQANNLKRRAEGIAKKIAHGENFQKMAELEASTPSPDQKHVLDWSTKDELPTAFINAFKTFQVGESKGPIRTANGWHIIKILKRKVNGKSMTNDQIKQLLFRQKYNAAIESWLKELRQSSDVHVLNESS